MDNFILADVKAACSIAEDDNGFDEQLKQLINSQLMVARQFGVGRDGFMVQSGNETWDDLLGEHGSQLAAIKTWLGYSVLLMFDPPDNGSVLKAYQDQLQKLEWMLYNKTEVEGHVKSYVPEQADFYDELYEYDGVRGSNSDDDL